MSVRVKHMRKLNDLLPESLIYYIFEHVYLLVKVLVKQLTLVYGVQLEKKINSYASVIFLEFIAQIYYSTFINGNLETHITIEISLNISM